MATRHREEIYIGLDIGSTKVCCLVGLAEPGDPAPSIIGVGQEPTTGLRKGVVVDVDETVSSITAAIEEAERMSGVTIERATISVDGAATSSLNSRGVIAIGRGDGEIGPDDLLRVDEAAMAVQLPANHEIIQVLPRFYKVDSQSNIKDPLGMQGVRLEVESHLVTAATPALRNLERAISQGGITIQGRILAPIAAARAVLTKRQRELGVVLVDIGGGTTGIAVYEGGEVYSSAVLPIGAGHITNDLAIGLRTDLDTAEKIKLQHVRAFYPKGVPDEKLRLEELGGDDQVIDRSELQNIAGARLDEFFGLIGAELKRVGRDGRLPGGVVLTGGGAKMPGIEDLARERLQLPVVIGHPTEFSGLSDQIGDPAYATAVGLMLENAAYAGLDRGANAKLGTAVDKLRKTLRNLLP